MLLLGEAPDRHAIACARAGLPTVLFKPGMDRNTRDTSDSGNREECSICLDEYTAGTPLLQLPCRHLFHPACIRSWFQGHNFCPLCKFVLTGRVTRAASEAAAAVDAPAQAWPRAAPDGGGGQAGRPVDPVHVWDAHVPRSARGSAGAHAIERCPRIPEMESSPDHGGSLGGVRQRQVHRWCSHATREGAHGEQARAGRQHGNALVSDAHSDSASSSVLSSSSSGGGATPGAGPMAASSSCQHGASAHSQALAARDACHRYANGQRLRQHLRRLHQSAHGTQSAHPHLPTGSSVGNDTELAQLSSPSSAPLPSRGPERESTQERPCSAAWPVMHAADASVHKGDASLGDGQVTGISGALESQPGQAGAQRPVRTDTVPGSSGDGSHNGASPAHRGSWARNTVMPA